MFFFNETAYTETYTYCHTLALHDALPICQRRYGEIVDPEGAPPCQPGREGHRGDGERQAERLDQIVLFRSEEHTSELQSLMRISYAVFCLKTINLISMENGYIVS